MDEKATHAMRRVLLALVLTIVIGGTGDLVLDAPASWLSGHVIYELVLIGGSLTTAVWLWLGWRRAAESTAELQRSLEERKVERDAWRESAHKALDGLAKAIDAQFRTWALTPAEREVALQLLKGRSHKEIAAAAGRSERTVRQHAVAVYQKSGLGGRAELAAFFLEDLMLPMAQQMGR